MAKIEKNKDKKNKRFFKDFKAELKKVIWLTPKQVAKNTMVVATIVVATALIVFVLDMTFELFNEYGINKLKANIKNKMTVENIVENVDTNIIEENTTENETTQENVQ